MAPPPNNFTNHSAYQYRYDPIRWQERSPERDLTPGVSIAYKSIPPFYFQSPLVAAAQGIIEYPVLIGDQLNLYYYYQHFHRRPVVAGFVTDNVYAPLEPGRDFVFGDWPIDSVMGAMPAAFRKSASWKTMVDLHDSSALRSRFKGWIIVIHRDPAQRDLPTGFRWLCHECAAGRRPVYQPGCSRGNERSACRLEDRIGACGWLPMHREKEGLSCLNTY